MHRGFVSNPRETLDPFVPNAISLRGNALMGNASSTGVNYSVLTQELMDTVVEIDLAANPKLEEIAFNPERAQRNFVIDASSFRGRFYSSV